MTEGAAHLSDDPVLGPLVRSQPRPALPPSDGTYPDLLDSIVGQQLSVKAAASIRGKLVALLGENWRDPAAVLARTHEELRSAGLSHAKARYIRGIANAVRSGDIVLHSLASEPDEAVVEAMVKLPGVGPWTAEMMLIFSFCRPDVFSVGDLGIRNAVARLTGVDREDRTGILAMAGAWSPYRSLACRYLWNSLENPPLTAA